MLGVTFSFLYGFWYLMVFVGAGMAFVVLYLFYKNFENSVEVIIDMRKISRGLYG